MLSGLLAATGVAAIVAAAGAVLLGRRPRSLRGWNEAFLAGCGASAAVLFPLSVVVPGAAIGVLLLLLLVAAAVAPFLPPSPDGEPGEGLDLRQIRPIDMALLVVIAVSVAAFVTVNARYHLLWDGLYIWSTKALLLFEEGGLAPELWTGSVVEGRVGRVVGYPPLVPLLEALAGVLRGRFSFEGAKPVISFLFLSLLSGTWSAARALLPQREALAATALVAALPGVSTFWAAGGYADMPQAATLVALVAVLLRPADDARPGWRQPVPWLFAALVSVKNEGTLLAVLVLGAWGLGAAVSLGLSRAGKEARRRASGLLLVALVLGLRALYVRWTIAPEIDEEFARLDASAVRVALHRLPTLSGLVAAEMLRIEKWGLLWPALLAGSAILLVRREPVRAVLAAATLAAVAAYASTFLFTNWTLEVHVATALDRILSQLAPVAVLVTVAALAPPGPKQEG